MIHIVTDSDANLPADLVDGLGIHVVPIHLVFGEEVLREGVEISNEEAYRRMAEGGVLPTTSQPPVGEFRAVYEAIRAADPAAEILSLHISRTLSGTVGSAQQAAALVDGVTVFDTRSISLGQGLMVREAARMAAEGRPMPEIVACMDDMREQMQIFFVLETLDHLARSGRIGRASHLVGNLLDIRPILTVQEGVVVPYSRHRTFNRALGEMQRLVEARAEPGPWLQVGVVHAGAEAEAEQMAGALRAALDPGVLLFSEIGPGIGVHVGPGSVGVCWAVVRDGAGR